MGRIAQPFTLKPAELAALQAAQRNYAAWWDGMRPLASEKFTTLRKAAQGFRLALEPFNDAAPLNRERARLLARLQQAEGHRRFQDEVRTELAVLAVTVALIERAAAAEVRGGCRPDEKAHSWIRHAAAAWREAGLNVTPGGRFAAALADFRAARVPLVGDRDQIRKALQ